MASLYQGMRTFLLFILCLSVIINTSVALAVEERSLESFLAKIQEASDRVCSFSCTFTQEKHLAMFAQPVLFQGRLAIIRPDKLRWEFTHPVPSVLILSGERGIRCNDQVAPVHFQLADDPVMKMVAGQLWYWFGGKYSRLSEKYTVEKQGPATLVITPGNKAESEYISSVKIVFDEQLLQPKIVEIAEAGGDLTRIIFSSPVINSELSEDLFTDCSING